MQYAEKINGTWVQKTPTQFRKEREANIPDSRLEEKGLYQVTEDPRPAVSNTERSMPGPIEDRNGRPFQTWVITDKTPEQIADDATQARERMVVNRWQFATSCMIWGIVTPEEAMAWSPGNALPAGVEAAITSAIADSGQLAGAKIKALSAPTISRTNPLIAILQQAYSLTDERVDEIFETAAGLE